MYRLRHKRYMQTIPLQQALGAGQEEGSMCKTRETISLDDIFPDTTQTIKNITDAPDSPDTPNLREDPIHEVLCLTVQVRSAKVPVTSRFPHTIQSPVTTDLQIGGDGHVDDLAVRSDPVQQDGVVEGRVPGSLEPENGPRVACPSPKADQ